MLDLAIPLVGKPGNSAKFGFDVPSRAPVKAASHVADRVRTP